MKGLVEDLKIANDNLYSANKMLEKEIERLKEDNKYLNKVNIELSTEKNRLNNIINDIDRYIHNWGLEDIGEKTMLILNDILLIKNGMSDEVTRLKGEDKE